MTLNVAIQMDPPEKFNIDKDSTFALGMEAQRRGYNLFYYHPSSLSLENGQVHAKVAPLTFRREQANHFSLGELKTYDLTFFDIILMRQDPPFDLAYITATHILDHIKDKVLVLNDPSGVRNSPEKLLVTHYPHLAPPTLITADKSQIFDFWKSHQDIVLKPLYGYEGMHVTRLRPDDDNFNTLMDLYKAFYIEPIIAQKYLPEVLTGDKRLVVIEGEPAGAILRVPQKGDMRANLHVGGIAAPTEITERDKEICAQIKPELIKRGLVFVGLDIIGSLLTEINVTSPTCLQQINRLYGECMESKIWDAYEARMLARKKAA